MTLRDDDDGQCAMELAARMMRSALRALADAANGNAAALQCALLRASGCSLSDIARRTGVSRQTVCNRLRRMRRRSAAAEAYIDAGKLRRSSHD